MILDDDATLNSWKEIYNILRKNVCDRFLNLFFSKTKQHTYVDILGIINLFSREESTNLWRM